MEKEKPFFSKDEPFFDKPFFNQDVRKTLENISEALKGKTEKITQWSKYVGYFCPLVKTEESVRRGQKIGFIRIKGLDKEEAVEAEADGIIKEILPAAKTGFAAGETKEQYETADEEGNKQQKERTFTSVEYGQALFILDQSKPDK